MKGKGMGIDAKKFHGAGKGAAPRKGANNEKYRANYDKIFKEPGINNPQKENQHAKK